MSLIGIALLIVGTACNIGLFFSLRAYFRASSPAPLPPPQLWTCSGSDWASNAPLTEGMVRKGGQNDLSKVDRSKRPSPPAPMRRAGIEVPFRKVG